MHRCSPHPPAPKGTNRRRLPPTRCHFVHAPPLRPCKRRTKPRVIGAAAAPPVAQAPRCACLFPHPDWGRGNGFGVRPALMRYPMQWHPRRRYEGCQCKLHRGWAHGTVMTGPPLSLPTPEGGGGGGGGSVRGGRPGQRVEEQGTSASRTLKRSEAGDGRPVARGQWAAQTVKRPPQQPAQPPIRQLLGATDTQTAHDATSSTAPAHQPLGTANAERTPAAAPAAAADRTRRPDATCGGKNG